MTQTNNITFSIRRYWAVVIKEFLQLKRNVIFFLMTVLGPVIFFFLFAYGMPLDAKNNSMAVVDFNKSAASRSLIDQFENATDLFKVKLVTDNYPQAMEQINLGRVRIILVIPTYFEQNIKKGIPIEVQALIDGAYPNTANLVGGYFDAILAEYSSQILAKYSSIRPGYKLIDAVPIEVKASGWYNSAFRSNDFMIPAIIALVMIFFPPIVATISLAREKETGSILNMYCSSLRKAEYLLGKMTPYIIISFINLILFMAFAFFLFDVPMRGSIFVIFLTSFFYISAVIAVGLLVAVLVKSQVAAILITFVGTVMPSFLFSGFMVPISSMEKNAQMTSYFIPTTYEIDLLRKVMVKGASTSYVAVDIAMILVFFVGLYALCIKLFKKQIG